MEKLSKEELLAIINKEKKPPRKKPEMTAEKRTELLERLSDMRETVKKNREAKKVVVEPERDLDAIFEKKYNSKFEKIEATLSEVSDGQKELIRLKKEKQAKKAELPKVAEPVKAPEVTKASEVTKAPEPVKAPVIQETPRNPNIFLKGRTRF
jgi:hypothetical protein